MLLLRASLFLILLFSIPFRCFSQKVGVVLSGGGASGLAHIGVLKALEENNIPIDYITGTSIGAFVGALYASGYSPAQIETFIRSDAFREKAYGNIEKNYSYYFRKEEADASLINIKLSLDSAFETNLPTNLISTIAIDFTLMELFAQATAAANYNFDSLFIPFRCLASDIEAKESVVFMNGDIGQAIRASITYPFYMRPISMDGRLLFDGGLYNNFPSDVMYEDFFPDVIIGSNVTENVPPPTEDNLILQVRNMFISKTNYNVLCESGIFIEPEVKEIGLFDFDNPQQIIDSGYSATIRQLEQIRHSISRKSSIDDLNKKRMEFNNKKKEVIIDKIEIEGLTKRSQTKYIEKSLRGKNELLKMKELKKRYFRLAADNNIKHIFPVAQYDKETEHFNLLIHARKEKPFVVKFGGNFSNRPINTGYVGLEYNSFRKIALKLSGNTYFGKLYSSAQAKARLDFPGKISFYIEPQLTFNRFDFFNSNIANSAFFEDIKPPYLIYGDQYAQVDIGIPVGGRNKFYGGSAVARTINRYYQTEQFNLADTADLTYFNTATSHLSFESNTLNRKLYANEGTYFLVKVRHVNGNEITQPGSTANDKTIFNQHHNWFVFKTVFDSYFKQKGIIHLGVYAEGVYSSQSFFHNYTASILAAPAFQPISESKTLFLENYRSHQYIAGGIKSILYFKKGIEFRMEGYIFQPYRAIQQNPDLTASYKKMIEQQYIANANIIYHTPVGPLSFSTNYYGKKKGNTFSFLFHFGYVLFNKKALD